MVVYHHIEHLRRQPLGRAQGVEAILWMLAHDGHLVFVESAGLFENGERNACLADIVKHPGE